MSSVEDKILTFLVENLDTYQNYFNKHENVPQFVLYDVLIKDIEKHTSCNYIDIITFLDQDRFNNLFMLGGNSIEN